MNGAAATTTGPVHVERLRYATPAELAAIDAIGHASFPAETFSTAEELARHLACFWVARSERGGPPVAFLAGLKVVDELHVLNVATAPALRRRGIARALMTTILREARADGVAHLLLDVRRGNTTAIDLYKSLGFRTTGIRPRYYADNDEDAVEMALSFGDE